MKKEKRNALRSKALGLLNEYFVVHTGELQFNDTKSLVEAYNISDDLGPDLQVVYRAIFAEYLIGDPVYDNKHTEHGRSHKYPEPSIKQRSSWE